jgi:hypothetical protein
MQTDSKSLVNLSIGYGLLLTGIFMMFLAFFQVFRVFLQGEPVPVKIFAFEGVKIDMARLIPKTDTSTLSEAAKKLNLNIQMPAQEIEPMETEIISAKMLNDSANLGAFVLFMSFMLNFGGKLSGIGVSLVTKK